MVHCEFTGEDLPDANITWGQRDDITGKVAAVSDQWLRNFAVNYPQYCRKLGDSRQSTFLIYGPKVIQLVNQGVTFKEKKHEGAETSLV